MDLSVPLSFTMYSDRVSYISVDLVETDLFFIDFVQIAFYAARAANSWNALYISVCYLMIPINTE
jgi:hypothetical protein